MIKGVNHQVVEVNDTASEYFERIIFFVKPEYSFVSEGKIRERASKIANASALPPPTRKSAREKIGSFIKTAAAAVMGAAAMFLILQFAV